MKRNLYLVIDLPNTRSIENSEQMRITFWLVDRKAKPKGN